MLKVTEDWTGEIRKNSDFFFYCEIRKNKSKQTRVSRNPEIFDFMSDIKKMMFQDITKS